MGTFFREMLRADIYKRTQGRIARQATFAGLALAIGVGLWRLSTIMAGKGPGYQYALPGVLMLLNLWICYRVVNLPGFADFLIAVEAEMNKVSWPTRSELFRASLVVLLLIFSLAIILFGFDSFWGLFFRWTRIL
ncbi:MAG: preprotein translocase subunit SecE [Planctomycetaceae bacterium]|nr:preprotein translocase subunit SecE [Planctomycetaceae bacterium]